MSIRIFTDSASDITRAELEELQAELIVATAVWRGNLCG